MNAPSFKVFCFAVAAATAIGHAAYGEGRPSRQALEDMGLSGLAVISDESAMSISRSPDQFARPEMDLSRFSAAKAPRACPPPAARRTSRAAREAS